MFNWFLKHLTPPILSVVVAMAALGFYQSGFLGQSSAELAFKDHTHRTALKQFRRYCYPSVQLWLVNGYDHDVCMSKVGELVEVFEPGLLASGYQTAQVANIEETDHNEAMREDTSNRLQDALSGKYKLEFKMPMTKDIR